MPQYSKKQQTKRVKLPSRKRLVKMLDDEIRRICRARDKYCGACGLKNDDTGQVSHYIGRRHYALRWDLKNCNLQHAGCNMIHNYNPAPYSVWMISKYGEGILIELQDIKNTFTKYTNPQLRDLLADLREVTA